MSTTPFMDAASSRAARIGNPGCYAFTNAQPPVTKLADNDRDQIIDVEATEALYAGQAIVE